MKISMNNVGNYNPTIKFKSTGNEKVKPEDNNVKTSKPAVPVEKAITDDEKNYFMKLYPQNQNEIADYHFYQKSGKMTGVKIGLQIDKRG